jgi:hypothetical protein
VIRFVEGVVAFVSRKSKGKTETAAAKAPGRAQRLVLFGPPPLIEGEDVAAYEQLRVRICAKVKPVDIIDEIFIDDIVSLEWEILRARRLKSSLFQARGLEALERFLAKQLDDYFYVYAERLPDRLADILLDLLGENRVDVAVRLACKCAQEDRDAIDEVQEILARVGLNINRVLDDLRDNKAKELVQQYVRREPCATKVINFLLAETGVSMDALMAAALVGELDNIERIDRLTTIAENRRNATLREIDRRRSILGEMLRRSVQEIEDGEFKVIETTPAKRKDAA